MARRAPTQYVWVMERFDPFDRPPSTTFLAHTVELRSRVREEEFERYVIEELFPALGSMPTRRWHVTAHHLLKRGEAVTNPLESALRTYVHDESLRQRWTDSASSITSGAFIRVGGWTAHTAPAET